jgi:transposase
MKFTRTAVELEHRRRDAVDRVKAGSSQTQVAEIFGVTPRTVRRWLKAHREGGEDALRAKPRPGPTPKLTVEQARQVLDWLRQKPSAFGFRTELWTAKRIAHLIRQQFGVSMNHRYLNTWLSRRDITPQKPKKQARERDQTRIDRWLAEEWPRILKKGRPKKLISF